MSATATRMVGPVIRGADARVVDAVIEAITADNPDAAVKVDDQGGYVRISCPQTCRLTRASLEEAIEEPYSLSRLETSLSGFAGRMRYLGDDEIVWYLERED